MTSPRSPVADQAISHAANEAAGPKTAAALDLVTGIGAHAAAQPDALATEAFGKPWTWSALAERIARTTTVLQNLDIGPSRRLGMMLPPCPTAIVTSAAALRLGAEVVPCNPLLLGAALRDQLDEIGEGVLVSIDLLGIQDRWLPTLPEVALSAVLIERMADLLPFPKNLILPMMRGSQIAATPIAERAKSLRGLLRRAEPAAAPAAQALAASAILDEDNPPLAFDRLSQAGTELLAEADRVAGPEAGWLYAHAPSSAWALITALAPLSAGRRLSISPRLHPKSVGQDITGKQPGVAVLSPTLAESVARDPSILGPLQLVILSPATDAAVTDILEAAGQRLGFEVLVWDGLPV